MKRAPEGLLPHLEWFVSHHPFQTVLICVVLGVLIEKFILVRASRRGKGPNLKELALQPRQWVHLGTAAAALASVGHSWLSDASELIDVICK